MCVTLSISTTASSLSGGSSEIAGNQFFGGVLLAVLRDFRLCEDGDLRRSCDFSRPALFGAIHSLRVRVRKQQFAETCCRLVKTKPETTHDNFLRDFGERFVPGYKALLTVDLLMNAPFDE